MSMKRNWFIMLSLIIYMTASLLILIFGVNQFQGTGNYPYLMQISLIIGFIVAVLTINLICILITRPVILCFFSRRTRLKVILETLLVLLILLGGSLLRIYYIRQFPVDMESDYRFYYEVAIMIKDGTLTTLSDNEYISLFPHTYGYAYILSLAFRIFGTGKSVGLYLNVAFSVLTSLFCYGIGKRISGTVAGLCALTLTCFWPSQVIFSNINGAEASFTCFLYFATYMTIILMTWNSNTKSGAVKIILLHIFCGALIAIASGIRPMALVLLIACVIGFLSMNQKLEYKNITKVPFKTIFLSKGYLRAGMLILGYVVCSVIISSSVSKAIGKEISSTGAMGYSLMVGLDIESEGGYSEKPMNYLYQVYNKTKSASDANDACMDKAIEEVKKNPVGILELMAKKFVIIWSNDDYATTTNIVTMNNQRLLTKNLEAMLYSIANINNIYYLLIVFLSAIGVLFLMQKDSVSSLFAVFFVGTIALFLLVEVQNRYHYFALQSIAILGAAGIGVLYEFHKKNALEKVQYRTQSAAALAAASLETSEVSLLPQKQMSDNKEEVHSLPTIDVLKAIQEGHIIITATKSYEDEAKEKDMESCHNS